MSQSSGDEAAIPSPLKIHHHDIWKTVSDPTEIATRLQKQKHIQTVSQNTDHDDLEPSRTTRLRFRVQDSTDLNFPSLGLVLRPNLSSW